MTSDTICYESRCACRGHACLPCAQGKHRIEAERHVDAIRVGNPCGGEYCDDLPDEPGPCRAFTPCECDFPPVANFVHCRTCQHAKACHERTGASA